MMKRWVFWMAIGLGLAGCASSGTTPSPAPLISPPVVATPAASPQLVTPFSATALPGELTPTGGKGGLVQGSVFLETQAVTLINQKPVLNLSGNLPTPCHQVQVEVKPPDEEQRIQVTVYSLVDPTKLCVQVLQPFEKSVPLGDLHAGAYSVWVNGKKVGDVMVP